MPWALAVVLTAVTATPMSGPHAKVASFCKPCADERTAAKTGPYRDVRVVVAGDRKVRPTLHSQVHHRLAVKTSSGWFSFDLGTDGVICGGDFQLSHSYTVTALQVKDVIPGGDPEIIIQAEQTTMGASQIDDRTIFVCGLGPSGTPSCTDALRYYRFTGTMKSSWMTSPSFRPDGTLDFLDDTGAVSSSMSITFP
jgi:hypothetical protein